MRKIKDIVSAICLFFLFLNPVFAQTTAAILPEGKTQFLDNNGNPLSSGKVYFYIPSTTTFKTTWQDSAKTTPNTNPVILDAGGRAIIYGDGNYRQRVLNSANTLIYDAVTTSTGAGGNTPTAFGDGAAVGSIKSWAGLVPPLNYVYSYGQELSRTTYIALFSAITLTQNLSCASGSPILTGLSDTSQIPVGAVLESTCISAGSTVISKASTTVTMNTNSSLTTSTTGVFFLYGNGNGTTTFNVPDLRGNVIAGRCNMGGVDCTNLTVTGLGETSSATGAVGGNQTKTLVTTNLPPYTPAGTNGNITAAGTVSAPTISMSASANSVVNAGTGSSANLTGGGGALNQAAITATSSAPIFSGTPVSGGTFTGTAQGGTSTPFSIIQPTITLNYVIKILPDVSLSTTSVVTSLGAMTGDITCGTWLLCSSQNIAVSINSTATTLLGNPSNGGAIAGLFTIQGLTNQASPDPNNDFVLLYNAASGSLQKVTAGTLGAIGVAGVSSFNGRIGAVSPLIGDYTASIVNFTPIGTGGVVRTTAAKVNDIVSVQDFGAKCDGATDDTAAFQAAIDAVQPNVAAFTGGRVTIATYPNANALSVCVITGPVTLRGRVTISGNGMGTNITTNHATNDVFVMVSGENTIENLKFSASVTRSGGAYIKFNNSAGLVRNVSMSGGYDNISVDGALSPWTIEDVNATLTVHRGITCTGSTDLGNINRVVMSGNGHAAANTAGYWTDRCSDIVITNSQFLSFEHGISLEACASCDIADNQFTNDFLDQNLIGFFVSANNLNSTVSRNYLTNVKTTSSFGEGFKTNTASNGAVKGLVVTGHVSYGSAAAGINVTGNTTGFQLSGGFAAFNSGSGVLIGANVTDFSIINFHSGTFGSFGANAGFGVEVAAGTSDNYKITLNTLLGNVGGSKSDSGTGTNKIVNNNICSGSIC